MWEELRPVPESDEEAFREHQQDDEEYLGLPA